MMKSKENQRGISYKQNVSTNSERNPSEFVTFAKGVGKIAESLSEKED